MCILVVVGIVVVGGVFIASILVFGILALAMGDTPKNDKNSDA